MGFTPGGIRGMLEEYETDNHSGMNVEEIAGLIFDYTSGYPFLVSRLCKLMDEEVAGSVSFPDKACLLYTSFRSGKRKWTGDGSENA